MWAKQDAGYGRSMHWIRVERFWEGEYPNIRMTHYQPVLCQQCGQAPCEPVCPAFATVHSQSEQLNLQVYNRCVGTRYCANNCPYQVRSFNWRDYTDERLDDAIATLKNQYNPDVTVRRRGIMEKCTFCIQRIHKAQDKAKSEGREVADGEFTTACAQACPARRHHLWHGWTIPKASSRRSGAPGAWRQTSGGVGHASAGDLSGGRRSDDRSIPRHRHNRANSISASST